MDRHRWISRNQQVWEYGCSFLYFDPETNRSILSYESLNDDTSLGNYFHPQYQKKNNGDILLSMKVRFLGHSCIEIIGYHHILIDKLSRYSDYLQHINKLTDFMLKKGALKCPIHLTN